MGWIAIENVEFFAHHGVYPEEQLTGNKFLVDVYAEIKMDSLTHPEDLSQTLNYETIFHCCKKVMRVPHQLLETVCIDIVQALKFQFPTLWSVKVRVKKMNPMPGEKVGNSFVEIEEKLSSKCPSCGQQFSCYKDKNCWCSKIEISESSQKALREKYKGCLCPTCLGQYAQ